MNSTITHRPEETRAFAAELARTLPPGAVVALHGDLGAGKTCFAQGIAEGLGVAREVTSPTFTLVSEHPGRIPMYHLDLYRISGAREALNLGIEEYLAGNGVTVIEWAERVEELLPPHTIHIRLAAGEHPNERVIRI